MEESLFAIRTQMKIELKEIKIRELVADYVDDGEGGVRGYSGQLDIRPPYQREFIYNDKQRNAVIDTIMKGFPLNVMYWSVRDDGTYEIIDGQQRTISIAQYAEGDFSFGEKYVHNLPEDKRTKFLDYELMVYLCSGTDSEKLEWFRIINIAGEKLTDQELRNAVYAGSWVSDAKRYFSRRGGGCPAYGIGKDYLNGSPIRQDYLETAIKWISKGNIEDHMGRHQDDENAKNLWEHYQSVIEWVEATFTEKRPKMMRGVDWGTLYDSYKDEKLDPEEIEEKVAKLILDDDVTSKSGIYPYILTRDQKYLNIRAFTQAMKQKVYEKQKGICGMCNKHFDVGDMEADHIKPWVEGGKTNEENCKLLCVNCNRTKSAK